MELISVGESATHITLIVLAQYFGVLKGGARGRAKQSYVEALVSGAKTTLSWGGLITVLNILISN